MKWITTYQPFQPLIANADHIDVKSFTTPAPLADAALPTFLAGFIAYQPGWMTALYGVRKVFVRLLGMRQEGIPKPPAYTPATLPFTPGAKAAFFTVEAAEPGRHWVAGATESHLTARVGVAIEPCGATARWHVATIVHYHRWTGPVYFNVIRPFHHLVVAQMIKAGRRSLAALPAAKAIG